MKKELISSLILIFIGCPILVFGQDYYIYQEYNATKTEFKKAIDIIELLQKNKMKELKKKKVIFIDDSNKLFRKNFNYNKVNFILNSFQNDLEKHTFIRAYTTKQSDSNYQRLFQIKVKLSKSRNEVYFQEIDGTFALNEGNEATQFTKDPFSSFYLISRYIWLIIPLFGLRKGRLFFYCIVYFSIAYLFNNFIAERFTETTSILITLAIPIVLNIFISTDKDVWYLKIFNSINLNPYKSVPNEAIDTYNSGYSERFQQAQQKHIDDMLFNEQLRQEAIERDQNMNSGLK